MRPLRNWEDLYAVFQARALRNNYHTTIPSCTAHVAFHSYGCGQYGRYMAGPSHEERQLDEALRDFCDLMRQGRE